MAPQKHVLQYAAKIYPEAAEQPFDVFFVCDTLSQFDEKYLRDMSKYNCNLYHVLPEKAERIEKNRKLRAIISVPELKCGNGFALLDGLRTHIGKNTPLMIYSSPQAA